MAAVGRKAFAGRRLQEGVRKEEQSEDLTWPYSSGAARLARLKKRRILTLPCRGPLAIAFLPHGLPAEGRHFIRSRRQPQLLQQRLDLRFTTPKLDERFHRIAAAALLQNAVEEAV